MTYHSHHLSCVRGQGSGYEETDSLRRDTSTKEQGEASVHNAVDVFPKTRFDILYHEVLRCYRSVIVNRFYGAPDVPAPDYWHSPQPHD